MNNWLLNLRLFNYEGKNTQTIIIATIENIRVAFSAASVIGFLPNFQNSNILIDSIGLITPMSRIKVKRIFANMLTSIYDISIVSQKEAIILP